MNIDSKTLATLGFAFSRSMYYAKMVEGIVDASEEYHRKLIDNTYDELYDNEDAKVFKYIYYLNKAYDSVQGKLDLFSDVIHDIDLYIDNIDLTFTRASNYVTNTEYADYYINFANEMESYYTKALEANKKFFIDLDSLDVDNLLDDKIYRFEDKYYIKHNGVLESLGHLDKDYYNTLKLYYQTKSLYSNYNDIYEYTKTYQDNFIFYDNPDRLDGYKITIDKDKSLKYSFIDTKNKGSKTISYNNNYTHGIDVTDFTVTQDKTTLTFKNPDFKYNYASVDVRNTENKILTSFDIDENNITYTIGNGLSYTYNNIIPSLDINCHGDKYSTGDNYSLSYDYFNSIAVGSDYKKFDKSFNYSYITPYLFDWSSYITNKNTAFRTELYLRQNGTEDNGTTAGWELYNKTYNPTWFDKMDSLPAKFELTDIQYTGTSIKPYGENDEDKGHFNGFDKTLLKPYTTSTYKYHRDASGSNYETLKFTLPNIQVYANNISYTRNNNKIYFTITFNKYVGGINKGNYVKNLSIPIREPTATITNPITNISANITNGNSYINFQFANNSVTGGNGTEYNIPIQYVNYLPDINTELYGDNYLVAWIKIKNTDVMFPIIYGAGKDYYSRRVTGDKIINTLSDESIIYNDGIISTYTVNNYVQTSQDNLYGIKLVDKIVNYKQLGFKQKFDINYDEDNHIEYTEHLIFSNGTIDYDIHRNIKSEVDNFNIEYETRQLDDNTITESYKIYINELTLNPSTTVTHSNRKLTNVLYDFNSLYSQIKFVYNFDLDEYNKNHDTELVKLNYGDIVLNDDNKTGYLSSDKSYMLQVDNIKFRTNYSVVERNNNDDIEIVSNSGTSVVSSIYDDNGNESRKFVTEDFIKTNNVIEDFLNKSYVAADETVDERSAIHVNYNNEIIALNINEGDLDEPYKYDADNERIILAADYDGTSISQDAVTEAAETIIFGWAYTVNVTIKKGEGKKRTMLLPPDYRAFNAVHVNIVNQNTMDLRLLATAIDCTFKDDPDIPINFYVIPGANKGINNNTVTIKLNNSKPNAKCTVMTLDY